MIEIRFHARAGQGAKSAAQLIAEAALDKGKFIQAFPNYGPERSGAPMTTYVRIDDKPITTHQPITNPDIVAVIDSTLLDFVNVTQGMKEDSILIVNTPKDKEWVKNKTGFNGNIYTLDATRIALDNLKRDIPNLPIIGAIIKLTGIVRLEDLENHIRDMFIKKLGKEMTEANIKCLKQGYEAVS